MHRKVQAGIGHDIITARHRQARTQHRHSRQSCRCFCFQYPTNGGPAQQAHTTGSSSSSIIIIHSRSSFSPRLSTSSMFCFMMLWMSARSSLSRAMLFRLWGSRKSFRFFWITCGRPTVHFQQGTELGGWLWSATDKALHASADAYTYPPTPAPQHQHLDRSWDLADQRNGNTSPDEQPHNYPPCQT